MLCHEKILKIALEEYGNKNFDKAIDAFNKSIALRDDWRSYQGLGFALGETQQYQKAIDAFSKSIALHADWRSYQGIGFALFEIKQYKKAIGAFNKSIALHGDCRSYIDLALSLRKLGRQEQAVKATQIIYRLGDRSPHVKIDPYLGQKNKVTVTRDLIKKIQRDLSDIQFAFHPSFLTEVEEDNQLQHWKHLIHIHIPKCAGSNFIDPLAELPTEYAKACKNYNFKISSSRCKDYLWHGNLKGKITHDAFILEAFNGRKLDTLQGSLLANHGAKHAIYCERLSEADILPKKVCLVRNPSQRLYSHVRMIGKNCHDKKDLLNKCLNESIYNIMDRYIYDYNLYADREEAPYCNPTDYKNCDSIDFLDISDEISISMLKSSFLSATLMPNMVQYNRINTNKKNMDDSLKEKDFQDVYKELILRGCLERDELIDIEHLKHKTKKRMNFPKIVQMGVTLHPLTYVYSKDCRGKLILTKDFISNPLSAIHI